MSFTEIELRRLAKQLVNTDPANTSEYLEILRSMECFKSLSDELNLDSIMTDGAIVDALHLVKKEEPAKVDPDFAIPDETPFEEPSCVATEPTPVEPTPVETPTPTESAVTYELADIRKALTEAKKNGMNVAEFIRSFGVDNVTAIPQAKYPEVMQKLGVN